MRKILISTPLELPEALSLNAYAPTSKFQIQDWCANLKLRALLRHVKKPENPKWTASYVLRNPLLSEYACGEFLSVALGGDILREQVFDLSAYDAFESHELFLKKMFTQKYTESFHKLNNNEWAEDAYRLLADTPYWKAKLESGITEDSDLVAAVVDLRMPEDLLVQKFREWLRATKAAKNGEIGKASITSASLVDLARFQVLAYLDLSYWADVNNVEITHQTMGLALFPDDYQIALAERIRKVVGPLARRVATVHYCDSLHLQVNSLGGKAERIFLSDSEKAFKDRPESAVEILFPSIRRQGEHL